MYKPNLHSTCDVDLLLKGATAITPMQAIDRLRNDRPSLKPLSQLLADADFEYAGNGAYAAAAGRAIHFAGYRLRDGVTLITLSTRDFFDRWHIVRTDECINLLSQLALTYRVWEVQAPEIDVAMYDTGLSRHRLPGFPRF